MDGFRFGTGEPYDFTMAGGTGAYEGVHGQAVIGQLGSTHFRWGRQDQALRHHPRGNGRGDP